MPASLPEAAERYLASLYFQIKGSSSKIAAVAAAHLLVAQSAEGVRGPVAEIGVYEGRFFIALALCALPEENAIATDVFDWPDEGVRDRFLGHCRAAGVSMERLVVHKAATQDLTPAAYREVAKGRIRFLHIDAGHTYDGVQHDLRLAKAALHWRGVICLDDVLHPRYPALTVAVTDWLKANPDFAIFAVLDRESFASACKFLISRRETLDFYRDALAAALPQRVMKIRADYFGVEALILSPGPV